MPGEGFSSEINRAQADVGGQGEEIESPYPDGKYDHNYSGPKFVKENLETRPSSPDFGLTKNTELTQQLADYEKELRDSKVSRTDEEIKKMVENKHRTLIGTAASKDYYLDADEAVARAVQGDPEGVGSLNSRALEAQRAMGGYNQLEKDSKEARSKRFPDVETKNE